MYFGASGAATFSDDSWSRDCMVSDILCGPHVLAIQRSDINRHGLLGFMRMFGAGINAQIAHLDAAERAARDHALDGLLDHALGEATLEDRLRAALLDATDEAGVLVIHLVFALATGQHDVRRVDDDDVVAAVDVGGVGREVFTAQAHRDEGGETTDDQTLGVDQHPLLRHLGRLCRKGFHVRESVKMEIGAKRAELRGFLENRTTCVNVKTYKLYPLKQWLINMVRCYRIKAYLVGME